MKKSEKCLLDMEYKLIWSERAITNLQNIESYIAEDSPYQAQGVINELLDYVEELKTFPSMGPVAFELSDMKLRQLTKYSYRIIYSLEESVITIVAIVHGRQNITAQFMKNNEL